MRRFRKEFGLKKARILRERLIPVSQRLKIGINRHPLGGHAADDPHGVGLPDLFYIGCIDKKFHVHPPLQVCLLFFYSI